MGGRGGHGFWGGGWLPLIWVPTRPPFGGGTDTIGDLWGAVMEGGAVNWGGGHKFWGVGSRPRFGS